MCAAVADQVVGGRLQRQVGVAQFGDHHAAQRLADQVIVADEAAVAVPLLAALQLDQRALLVLGHQHDRVTLLRDRLGVAGRRGLRDRRCFVGRQRGVWGQHSFGFVVAQG